MWLWKSVTSTDGASESPSTNAAFLETVPEMLTFVKSTCDPQALETVVELARASEANLFHYAAAVGDRDFFGIMMALLPVDVLTREMRLRNANGMTPLQCAASMHPTMATGVETFFLERGIDLDTAEDHDSCASQEHPVKLSDIVGMSKPREQLLEIVDAAKRNPRATMKPFLLQGPSGTGKSFLALCLAAELERDVVEIKCQDVLTHNLGGTEARIQAHFQRAVRLSTRAKKAVVVINEVESLCPAMGSDSSRGESWHATVRQCLLTLLDATLDPRSKFYGLLVVATTNYLERVDTAARDRMVVVHVPLPSLDDARLLLPALCLKHEPTLDVSRVDWSHVASVAHEQLSVRGLQDAIASVARKKSAVPVTTYDFESAVFERIGQIELKPLGRPDRFLRLAVAHALLLSGALPNVSLQTCLARCGWDFTSAPASVYRQVLTLESIAGQPSVCLILREIETDRVFSGSGCHHQLSTIVKPFDKYEVFAQCGDADGVGAVPAATMAVFLMSYGSSGVQKLKWETAQIISLYNSPMAATTVASFLAPLLKTFESRRVFVDATPKVLLSSVKDEDLLLIKDTDAQSHLVGPAAKLVAGIVPPEALRSLGYRAFVAASSSAQIVSPQTGVLVLPTNDATEMPSELRRRQVSPNRFVVCPNSSSTVGATLRANGVYYAAVDAVYVRQTHFGSARDLAAYDQKLLAVPISDAPPSVIWSGAAIAGFAVHESFHAVFQVYTVCTDAKQTLEPGMAVLLDMENLSPPLSADKKFMILRYYPSPGLVDANTATHHNVCVSESGVRVSDIGYRDDDWLKGFRRGWYEDAYWRTVGDSPHRFLSGGVVSNPYKFNVREEHDLGMDNKRVMVKLRDEGIVFCRGVGSDHANPLMACVLFHADGRVRDRNGFKGMMGRWDDIVQ